LRRPLELLAQPLHRLALLVAHRLDLGRVGFDPRLRLSEELLLPVRELGQTGRQRLLDAVEVARPVGEAFLDAALRDGQRVTELRAEPPLAVGQLGAAGVGDSPLLLGKERSGVGTGARERALELLRALRRLAVDELVQASLGGRELVVEPPRPEHTCEHAEGAEAGREADGEAGRGERALAVELGGEPDPCGHRSDADDGCRGDERAPGGTAEERGRERGGGDQDPRGEGDLERRIDVHRLDPRSAGAPAAPSRARSRPRR
jgi:hypothetical protein